MIDRDFAAYVEGLPPQDRVTVEQALRGLRHAFVRTPRHEPETMRRGVLRLIEALTVAARPG